MSEKSDDTDVGDFQQLLIWRLSLQLLVHGGFKVFADGSLLYEGCLQSLK